MMTAIDGTMAAIDETVTNDGAQIKDGATVTTGIVTTDVMTDVIMSDVMTVVIMGVASRDAVPAKGDAKNETAEVNAMEVPMVVEFPTVAEGKAQDTKGLARGATPLHKDEGADALNRDDGGNKKTLGEGRVAADHVSEIQS